ncbi:MAG: hypothetical protein KC591_01945, partial [Gemmatimonadetes bacterium]|nr:hypothetical protein [Gemmatimonadota bacterium]
GTPMDCFACHSGDYNSATDPNHVQSGFPTTCADCHTTTAWTPASFDHNTTGFPLTGRHTTVQCTQCHVGGQYSGTPTDCYACHQTDYNGTNNPNHAAAGFPTSCTDCHTTSGWTPADWDHDSQYFPIYSGKHQGKWNNDCTECHVNPNNFSQFECILCHEHSNRNQVDNDHRGENGYQYNSAACYNCHPRGRA